MEGLEDLNDEPDDGVRGEVLATAPPFLRGEVGQEVLVDKSEGIALELGGERCEESKQLDQGRTLELLVAPRQDILELRVGGLDGLDRLVGGLADIFTFGQVY